MRPRFFLGLPLASKEEVRAAVGEGEVIVFLKNSLLSFLFRTKVSGYCTRFCFHFFKVYAIPLLSPYIKVQQELPRQPLAVSPFVIRGRASPQRPRGG